MPAEFLCNLPKNLTTHLTHKLYAVFPLYFQNGWGMYRNKSLKGQRSTEKITQQPLSQRRQFPWHLLHRSLPRSSRHSPQLELHRRQRSCSPDKTASPAEWFLPWLPAWWSSVPTVPPALRRVPLQCLPPAGTAHHAPSPARCSRNFPEAPVQYSCRCHEYRP